MRQSSGLSAFSFSFPFPFPRSRRRTTIRRRPDGRTRARSRARTPGSRTCSGSRLSRNWAPTAPQAAILRVDPKTQATQLLIRMPKAMHVPVHWHSANETHTVIKGTMVFEHGGQPHELGPGGFNYIPARTPHQAWCSDDALVFITVDAGWDVNWVNGPPTKSDLGQRPPTN